MPKPPQRSATLSPGRERPNVRVRRRRSQRRKHDDDVEQCSAYSKSSLSSVKGSRRLRKTNSEDLVVMGIDADQSKQIQAILKTFDFAKYAQQLERLSVTQWENDKKESFSLTSDTDTEIGETVGRNDDTLVCAQEDQVSSPNLDDDIGRRSENVTHPGIKTGITTGLGGHPRGVIQFLPSLKQAQSQSGISNYDSYSANKCAKANQRKHSADGLECSAHSFAPTHNSYTRKSSLLTKQQAVTLNPMNELPIPAIDVGTTIMDNSNNLVESGPTADSLAGFTRFGRLLRQLRQLPSPDLPDLPSDNSNVSTPSLLSPLLTRHSYSMNTHRGVKSPNTPQNQSMSAADFYLWKRRSQTSLRRHEDMRTHVVRELYDIEDSYVKNLQLMVLKYMRPLKRPELCALVEPALVDEIFFQIPEILCCHESFLASIKQRLEHWDGRQRIGDVLVENLTKQALVDAYTAFINNWQSSKQALRQAMNNKPALVKYLERCSREHKNKLTLDSLLIMPVQRIPRYELLIKALLKHTPVDHNDYPLLLRAQREAHDLAIKIDNVEQEQGATEQMLQRLRELEAIINGLDDLVAYRRQLIRFDVVSVFNGSSRKDRCLFLLSDLLLITSVKKKTQGKSSGFLESHKFSLLMKISLDDLEIAKNTLPLVKKAQEELTQLQDDIRTLGQLSELTQTLRIDHTMVHDAIRSCADKAASKLEALNDQLRQDALLTTVELHVTTEDGFESIQTTFASADIRASWETAFRNARDALQQSLVQRPPPMLIKTLPLPRTRAGLHFTCAGTARDNSTQPSIWIGNSDGYIGQLCVLTALPDVDVQNCAGVGNARVTAICIVPSSQQSTSASCKSLPRPPTRLDSDSSDDENDEISGNNNSNNADNMSMATSNDSLTSCAGTKTVWLGTEEGLILIFDQMERRHRHRMQVSAAITAMHYADDKVWVGLQAGQLLIYERQSIAAPSSPTRSVTPLWSVEWLLESPRPVYFKEAVFSPISAICAPSQRVWAAAANQIHVIRDCRHELSFVVSADKSARVATLCVAGGVGVFLSLMESPLLKLYHSLSMECLLEINICPTVTKALSGYDDVIRQHKLACLRITSLVTCKHLLWIGTSAGVVLTLTVPHLTHNSTTLMQTPSITICPVGHAGPCRFLQATDASGPMIQEMSAKAGRRLSLHILPTTMMYVVSGGDGYEDYSNLADDEDKINTDNTNHLLIWNV